MKMDRQSRQPGFTLVEMLVVVVIIGILAALLLPAVNAVRRRAADARIAIEISNIERALEAYKQQHGDYPPSWPYPDNQTDADRARLKKHILKAWPHIENGELTTVTNLLLGYLDPAEAIPFWLGGFSSDPKHPFLGRGGPLVVDEAGDFYANAERNDGLFEFDKGRLSLGPAQLLGQNPEVIGQRSNDGDGQNDSFPVYVPRGSEMPLVYFDSRSYGNVFYPANPSDSTGAANPYLVNRSDPASNWGYEWAKERTFQIISAGRDNHYGSYAFLFDASLYPIFPIGTHYDPTLPPSPSVDGFPGVGGDNDNITNFSGGGTLEDAKP